MTPRERAALTEIEQAVGATLEEYAHRAHGVISSPEPKWFLDWLRERGHEVVPIDRPVGAS